jgi:hypothetical protein
MLEFPNGAIDPNMSRAGRPVPTRLHKDENRKHGEGTCGNIDVYMYMR